MVSIGMRSGSLLLLQLRVVADRSSRRIPDIQHDLFQVWPDMVQLLDEPAMPLRTDDRQNAVQRVADRFGVTCDLAIALIILRF
jgi:hypothetical protein